MTLRDLTAGAALVALFLGCGQSLDSIGDFPCARDGTCPSGWVCGGARCLKETACGTDGSCPSGLVCLSGKTCLPDQQCQLTTAKCPDTTRPKCSLTYSTETQSALQCVPAEGSAKEAQPCSWNKAVTYTSGRDSCDKGLYCSGFFASAKVPSATSPMCVKLCEGPTQCGEGLCALMSNDRDLGVCAVTCGVGECAGGRDCKWVEEVGTGAIRGTCLPYGSKGPQGSAASACEATTECAQGYDCWNIGTENGFYCHRTCDPAHPCLDGDLCLTDDRFPAGAGVCGCHLFTPGDCGAGRTCRIWGTSGKGFYTACSKDGTLGVGESCNSGACAAGLVCWSLAGAKDYYCRTLCDDAHPCTDGTCRAQEPNLVNGAGLCQ